MRAFIRRAGWGARGRLTARTAPHRRVIVHTEAGAPMSPNATPAQERARMRAIDAFHLSLGWSGFGYSEAPFPSGRVYEGRGVRRTGAHTVGFNHEFAFMLPGHGDRTPATDAQIDAMRDRIRTHIANGDLAPNYRVSGHRDHIPPGTKSCPGSKVYPQLSRLRDVDDQEDAEMNDAERAQLSRAAADAAEAKANTVKILEQLGDRPGFHSMAADVGRLRRGLRGVLEHLGVTVKDGP